jgi:hypothetical protein
MLGRDSPEHVVYLPSRISVGIPFIRCPLRDAERQGGGSQMIAGRSDACVGYVHQATLTM